jgi:chemotaxis protein methyltransferase WspC
MIDAFAKLLQEKIGLDAASIGLSAVERALQLRLTACGGPGLEDYYRRLLASPAEMQALVETVVVPETWFFRDPKAFEAVAAQALRTPGDKTVRFLCLPCSTGEEPYSLAMTLLDAGLAPGRFRIDAIDVSERVLSHARTGIYGRNSFRGRDHAFRGRHFEETSKGWVLDAAVRKQVQFHCGNLLEESSLTQSAGYDAIFCRNLLIYFDEATQRRAIHTLERLLAPHGLFCVGPAETGLLAAHEFTHARISLAFAFHKGKAKSAPIAAPVKKRTAAAVVALSPRRHGPPLHPRRSEPGRGDFQIGRTAPAALPQKFGDRAVAAPKEAPPSPADDLAQAVRLADEGRLEEVAKICHSVLKRSGASAQAYYLLGLVSDAADRGEEAAAYYRKALYLDPRHGETLLHYSLLTAKRGDPATAQALRERARRCMKEAA